MVCVLTDKWILVVKATTFTVQPSDHMEPRKKEAHGISASVLHRRGNRMITGVGGRGEYVGERRRRSRRDAGSGNGCDWKGSEGQEIE